MSTNTDAVTREQVEAWAKLAGIEHFTEQGLARLGDFAIFARQDRIQAEAVPQIKPWLLNQLRRFNECCEDSEADGHDVDKEDMHSLAEMGAVRPAPGGRHYMTDFGHYLLAAASTSDQS